MSEISVGRGVELEQQSMLDAIACVVSGRDATYISGPITTGRRFVDWYLGEGYAYEGSPEYLERFRDLVVRRNEAEILATATLERTRRSGPVVEPASLHMREWNQNDYARFWTGLIERFVRRVIVLDGWQFSVGCVAELNEAKRLEIPVEDQGGQIIGVGQARSMIAMAIEELEACHKRSPSLENIIRGLRTYAQ